MPELETHRVPDLTHDRLRSVSTDLAPWHDVLIPAWEAYLVCGGFPPAVAQHVAARGEPLAGERPAAKRRAGALPLPRENPRLRRSPVDVIHGDAFRRADWSQAQSKDLLRRLSANLCSPLNVASLANDTGIPQTSLKRRLDELREAFVVWPCHRQDNLRPKLGAQPKLYFTDPIYARLAPDSASDLTRLSQQQLGMALLRATERAAPPGSLVGYDQVLHHHTATRKKVNLSARTSAVSPSSPSMSMAGGAATL